MANAGVDRGKPSRELTPDGKPKDSVGRITYERGFHSLRHTFADTLKQQGVQENLISELMGHANSSITTGRYGKRYQAKVLLEVVRRLDYGGMAAGLKAQSDSLSTSA